MKTKLTLNFISIMGVLIFTVACANEEPQNADTGAFENALSRASFGTQASRIQFRPTANRTKYSLNVGAFDNVSGPTFSRTSITSSNSASYTMEGGTDVLEVTIVNSNTVSTSLNGAPPVIFTPRGTRLGARP